MPVPSEVRELISRFQRGQSTFQSDAYVEASVRQEFIDPLFRSLGWDVGNRLAWAEQYKEVVVEPSQGAGGQGKIPDYAFRVGPQVKFFVEAKRPKVSVQSDRDAARQIRGYGWNAGLPVCILTSFAEFAVYDTTIPPKLGDSSSVARIDYFPVDSYIDRWDWISALFGRQEVWRGSLEEFAASQPTRHGKTTVDVVFLEEIRRWRVALAKEISHKNPQLDARELNTAVQSTIDRVVFLRICEDRDVESFGELRSAARSSDVYKELLNLFHRADDRYNSGLFHFKTEPKRPSSPDLLAPKLTIGNNVLEGLLLDLYPPLSPFDFRFIGVEILGQVYEQFLGQVIHLDSARRIRIEDKPEVKKAGGVVYTPESVVKYICSLTLEQMFQEGNENRIIGVGRARDAHPLRVLDPACGSGSFLISAYQALLDWYLATLSKKPNIHSKGRDPALRPTGAGTWQLATSFRKRILLSHIFGVDIDPQAVEVTKLSLLLKCLEGETAATIAQQLKFFQDRALPDLDENIRCGNSLIGFDYLEYEPAVTDDEERRAIVNMFDWHSEFPQVFSGAKPGFDIVMGNPPYVLLQDEFRDDRQLAYFRDRYRVASFKIDTYHLFLERGVQLTRSGGYFSMITPTNYLTNNYLAQLRTLLLDETAIDSITVIDGAVFVRRAVDCAVIASRPYSRTEKPFPVLRAQPGPHQSLVISGNLQVTPDRVRRSRDSLFTGTATGELASILDRMESSGTKLGDIAQISFGKQLRDRRKYPTDVLEVLQRRGGIPEGYARCYTGGDVRRWSVTWSGLALLDKEEARRGGCWDPKI